MVHHKDIDRLLIVTTLFLVMSGIVMVYSTSSFVALTKFGDEYFFVKKQLAYACLGLVGFFCAARFPYENYRKLVYPILLLAIVCLLMIFVPGVGHEVGGARRWVKILGFTFQPSELAKIAVVIFLAYSLEAKKDRLHEFYAGFLPNIIIPGIIVALVMSEPDFGTAVTIVASIFIMTFAAGVRLKHLGGLVLLTLPVLYMVVINFGYMMRRIRIFLDPWNDPTGDGFQMVQSFLAFGSGGVTGAGLGEGKQKLFYLPEAHTDFIFSVIGEEFGLIGVTVIIALYVCLLISGTRIGFNARDSFGTYLALGLTFMLVLQAGVNMAVVLGIFPPKGLPLPFISYGGTSLVLSMTAVGIILNVFIRGHEY